MRGLKSAQFPEEAGPLAHPVRPSSFIEINNFYTRTVYNKGAELCRMMQMVLGKDGFRRGLDVCFERHDGQAVTVEDFVSALGDANKTDLSEFMLWYNQAGTPTLDARMTYSQGTEIRPSHSEPVLSSYRSGREKKSRSHPRAAWAARQQWRRPAAERGWQAGA